MIDKSFLEAKLADANDKGDFLEELVLLIIDDLGFEYPRKQLSGSQNGFDVEGCLIDSDSSLLVWKFEAKNLTKNPTVEDIAPKILSHQRWRELSRFVIVSRLPISNDLHHILEGHDYPFDIDVWDLKKLQILITFSQKAIDFLGLTFKSVTVDDRYYQIARYPKKDIVFHLVHALEEKPFSFDYIMPTEKLVKCYTENFFTLVGYCSNTSNVPIIINEIVVRTVHYEFYSKRVFRQHKAKGLFEPIRMKFNPMPTTGGEINILPDGQWLKIDARSDEYLEIQLDDNAIPGYYELSVVFKGLQRGEPTIFRGFTFPLHIKNPDSDLLQFIVAGKHYDSVAQDILSVNDIDWNGLKNLVENTKEPIFLGPTPNCVSQGVVEDNWKLKRMPIDTIVDGEAIIDGNTRAQIVKELNIPIKEAVFSLADAIRDVLGP